MKEKRWTGGAPLTMSPSLCPLGSGSPGDTEERTTGSDRPQDREAEWGWEGCVQLPREQGPGQGSGRLPGLPMLVSSWEAEAHQA